MKNKLKLMLLGLAFSLTAGAQDVAKEKAFIKDNMTFAAQQYALMMKTPAQGKDGKAVMPHTMRKDGKVSKGSIYLWTAGFFPGSLWYLADYTGDKALRDSALVYTTYMEPAKTFTSNHDIGFMMYCSYGNANRFAPQPAYEDILTQSARSLCTRFHANTGVIQSWNGFRSWHGDKVYNYPVIIDNMMNLELLFHVAKVTGDDSFRKVAVSHAETTMKNQIRKDYSHFHVVYYDKETGAPIKGETSQGYADNSCWSRGQSWGIYGFTMCYRETGDKRFLKTAQGMADFYLDHPNLPSDKVALWDFNAWEEGYVPGVRSRASITPILYRDASAAACTASALLELSTYVKGSKSKKYFDGAVQILHSLGSPAYRAKLGENANFILMHSVGAIPHGSEIDVPLTYADYYFIEALHRYNRLLDGKPLF